MALPFFDQQAVTFYPATQDSYMKNTVTPDTSVVPGYSPYQKGMLTILGQTLQSISSAFQGDNAYWQRQQKVDQEQYQADLEFKAKLMQRSMANQALNQKQKSREQFMSMFNDMQDKGYNAIPYISADGGVGMRLQQDPEVQATRAVTTAARKKLDAQLPSIASTLKSIEDVEKYAKVLPESKPGVLEQTFAKGQSAIGKYAADKRYTDFEAAVNKLKTQAARSVMQEVGNLAQTEQENALKTFGDAPIPLENKISNLGNLKGSVLSGVNALLQSAGMTIDDLKEKHPEVYSRLVGGNISNAPSNTDFQSFNIGGKTYNIPADKVEAFKKAKGVK